MAFKKIGSEAFFRLGLFVAVFLLASLVLMSLTALQIGRELQVVVQFFPTMYKSPTMHEFSQLNTLFSIKSGPKDKAILDEMLVRYYLEMRYSQMQDVNEMVYRWGVGGPIYLLSSLRVYNTFAKDLEKKLDGLPEIVSSVEITRVERRGELLFVVDFRIYDNLPTGQVRFKDKNAVLEFRHVRGRRIFSRNFANPYGFTIVRFEETDRKTTLD